MIETILTVFIAVVTLGFLSGVFRRSGADETFEAPKTKSFADDDARHFELQPSLLVNPSEQALFVVLLNYASPLQIYVMVKPRLEDVIRVRRGLDRKEAWRLRGRVKSRHVDFLLMDWQGRPLAAVELDGKSHTEKTRNADALKDALFQRVGLPLHRIQVGEDFHTRAHTIVTQCKVAEI